VTRAFYGVLLARDLLEITKTRFNNASEHLSTIRSMRKQGLISEFDEMQAEIQVENIRPVILQMENILISAENGLKILLNIPQETKLAISGSMEYADQDLSSEQDLIAEALKANVTIKTLQIKRQLDDEFAAIDRGEYWPTLAAFGNYTYAGSGEGWDFQNYTSSVVGVSFSINLFQGGRTARKVEQALIVSRQTDEQLSTLKDATAAGVTSKVNELRRVQNLIELMQRNIDLAERAYQIATNRYKEGLGSELEVKDADVALSLAKTNYTNSVHDFIIAKAELDNLIGKVDPKYMESVKK
jgi:outer membrane protein TolC